MRATNKKRHGIMRVIYGIFLAIILVGVVLFFMFIIYGGTIPGITTEPSSSTSFNSPNSTVPAWVIITTTNKTLAKSIVTTIMIPPSMPPLILQPNTVYKYPVTVEVLNSAGKVLNMPVKVSFMYNFTGVPGLNASLTPNAGMSPFNATLIISTGNTVSMGEAHADLISWSVNLSSTPIPPYYGVQIFSILIANATSMKQ
ncbi:MAG: hypothetical protein QXV17_09560 [Candidatus Micrarchaeaceae archaeon]